MDLEKFHIKRWISNYHDALIKRWTDKSALPGNQVTVVTYSSSSYHTSTGAKQDVLRRVNRRYRSYQNWYPHGFKNFTLWLYFAIFLFILLTGPLFLLRSAFKLIGTTHDTVTLKALRLGTTIKQNRKNRSAVYIRQPELVVREVVKL